MLLVSYSRGDKQSDNIEYMNIWRINMKTREHSIQSPPQHWKDLGGRGLIAQILLDEVNPTCDPMGPENKLIFAPGLLAGHRLSSLDRISIGGKSPLTGGIKEANAGGRTAYQMALLGIKALIIEGTPDDPAWNLLYLNKDGVRFEDGNEYAGLGIYQSTGKIIAKYGEDIALSLIGPGGEMALKAAGIQNIDKDLVPSRIAARGGLGAVMGSKGVKAIVFNSQDCAQPPVNDLAKFTAARKKYTQALLDHPQTKTYAEYGTAAMASMTDHFGALPTRSFSAGSFEGIENINGDALRDTILKRGGVNNPTHACMAGCGIKCSNIYGDESGLNVIVSPIEYETIGLMGSNLGIDDLDSIATLNHKANDLGLDSIEIGAALGVACEAGLMEFGDADRALSLLEEITRGTDLGRALGNGAGDLGKVYGVKRVPVVKNQAMPAYDPRAVKGTGVTYATSPQGADHTSGLTIRAKIDPTSPTGQIDVSRTIQYLMAGYDTLGACIFAGFGFSMAKDTIAALLNAIQGTEYGDDILEVLGKRTIELELQFNTRAGFTPEDDRIPKWMTEEKLPQTNTVFDVPDDELDSIFQELR